jgi:Leucine-rich repeat (LRR) protein
MHFPSRRTVLMLMLVALTGCDRYRVTVNEMPVYEPAPLFSDFTIADRALFACVQQTIEDARITAAEQLTVLNCSHAGIARLEGLARFTRLEAINLSNNSISDVGPLAHNPRLRRLNLDGNQLRSVEALLALPNLETVSLAGNKALECAGAGILARRVTTTLPEHCRPGA